MAEPSPALSLAWVDPGGDPPPAIPVVERAQADAVAAVGRAGLRAAIAAGAETILPVDPPGDVPGVATDGIEAAIEALRSGAWTLRRFPIAVASVDPDRYRALIDLAIVADGPDRVATVTVEDDGRRLDRVRADGVVAATATGSADYARSVGAPVLSRDADLLAIAPMGPFETDPDHWVVDGVTITVDGPASLVADGAPIAELPGETGVNISPSDTIGLIVPETRS
ncbi:NAD(+)/NADH kinase [Halococcoides cellulosivorans]|uniref:ATP-NAD kinase n=1 Tax=Halococcoides cellulosivorans TaxID=1679096 RepID=A0A2R4X0R9_9EURY|nr:NAD(+)/NADH kinase [Halococcoides cellulosivorans]AWB27394.1 hypothetical protein HARCEL1_06600 [Halococcoides cellulosivorans]